MYRAISKTSNWVPQELLCVRTFWSCLAVRWCLVEASNATFCRCETSWNWKKKSSRLLTLYHILKFIQEACRDYQLHCVAVPMHFSASREVAGEYSPPRMQRLLTSRSVNNTLRLALDLRFLEESTFLNVLLANLELEYSSEISTAYWYAWIFVFDPEASKRTSLHLGTPALLLE